MAGCNCGGGTSGTTPVVYELTTPSGETSNYFSQAEASIARTKAGGGTIRTKTA